MYDELKERCRACSQGCDYPSECSYFNKPPLRCMRQLLSEAADAIEDLSKLNAEITRRELKLRMEKPRWTSVTDDTPSDFVSVQAHMTDAGNFPSVREAYVVNGHWFFPALKEFHPVDMWRRFDEPTKEEG